ncbi:beta-glucoside-specific PTS transporter subunit IIABC [Streptococcus uberis]|uniref:beta-glucoside-specific PTS transporter subunit IIABC n=1 Tax=Streptococcus uberis TaxID=1349 RepID=UPI001C97ADF4|nr:beta-glucoside-specific PTS transporter subunit IIABC [Streptococcus uberis]MBY4765043.1 beta-glucoside-specific PTS transporter subunit IIABC [Streptococcus uberis]MCV6815842.1 beta-glucoside-specific PTS transporter subunit IIABC [Streptococcus uberis]MCZ8475856.1 beta-glucoside-specific PTS transporter subunit IIABC [Streptococcus uberis]
MEVQKLGQDILNLVGGVSNVIQLEHCSTRLRFNLVDDTKADIESLKKLDGVLGVVQNVQTQVIVGSSVADVYNVINRKLDGKNNELMGKKKQSIGATILDYLVSIFQPLIPAIAGGGILKSFLMLAALIGILDKTSQTYMILNFIGDAPLRFLPLLVAVTTARKLKSNQLVALATVGALLTPDLTVMMGEGAKLFGIGITNVNYAYQVFPAILAVFTYSYLEKFFTKITPSVVRNFFVPMFSMLITVPLTLFILGPLGFTFGQGFASVIMFMFSKFGWIAVAVLASFLPFMVVTGMHKAMIPYVITSLGQSGKEIIYNAASLAHNISESGANFAVALRTKNKELRSTAISSGISALFGITEPALYGVTILHKRVLYSVMIGSFIGGASLGLMAVEAYVAVGPGLATLSMFISETLPNNLRNAVIGLIISFVVSFVTTFILWKEPVAVEGNDNLESEKSLVREDTKVFDTPLEGTIVPLENVSDDVFASKMLGEGIAIKPSKGELYAPVDAVVKMVYKTKHALGLVTEDGTELLIHIGINTVNLDGKYFDVLVKEGQAVKRGDLLVIFDIDRIVEAGFDSTTMLLFTKPTNPTFNVTDKKTVKQFERLLTIE